MKNIYETETLAIKLVCFLEENKADIAHLDEYQLILPVFLRLKRVGFILMTQTQLRKFLSLGDQLLQAITNPPVSLDMTTVEQLEREISELLTAEAESGLQVE